MNEGRIRCQETISGTLMQEPFSVPDTFFFSRWLGFNDAHG